MRRILVTGGAGYIGSHVCFELLQAGYEVVAVDNLSNSSPVPLERVQELTGRSLRFYEVNITDRTALQHVFATVPIDGVIHFAALKAVGESVTQPLRYYWNNVTGSLVLYEVMQAYGVTHLVFSSSATVYGEAREVPVREDLPLLPPTNPYGMSKQINEQILRDLQRADPAWKIAVLRYFNPIGAHSSGYIGEDPQGEPNNLFPYITQVAVGRRPRLSVFGGDYPTPDGTCIRDYIHVVDLAQGHLAALKQLTTAPGVLTYNLGTGRGYSVLEAIHAFERATGINIPYDIVDRRSGDVPVIYADATRAATEMGWSASATLEDMCRDAWRWQTQNPHGYQKPEQEP